MQRVGARVFYWLLVIGSFVAMFGQAEAGQRGSDGTLRLLF